MSRMSEAVKRLVAMKHWFESGNIASRYPAMSARMLECIAAVEAELNQKQDIEGTR